MSDMLVKLYSLPNSIQIIDALSQSGIHIRSPGAYEKHILIPWITSHFSNSWASECEVAFSHHPISCFIALHNTQIIGFACYDCTMLNFFGPVGIVEPFKKQGVGKALLLSCLNAMRAKGYAYAIIGSAGVPEFFQKAVGAIIIEGSEPGIYSERIRQN